MKFSTAYVYVGNAVSTFHKHTCLTQLRWFINSSAAVFKVTCIVMETQSVSLGQNAETLIFKTSLNNVVRMGKTRMQTKYWWRILFRNCHLED
jgi:hypothetical protein